MTSPDSVAWQAVAEIEQLQLRRQRQQQVDGPSYDAETVSDAMWHSTRL